MMSCEGVFELYQQRKKRLAPYHARALEIHRIYGGDFIVPLPEIDAAEQNADANMIHLGLEQTAMRVSSTMPAPVWPKTTRWGGAADERARTRRDVNKYWWEKTSYEIKMMKRARHLVGYAMSPVLLLPNFDVRCPEWHVRDPLTTFPAETLVGDIHPRDTIFVTNRPYGWLKDKYPAEAARLSKANEDVDECYEILEYVDGEEFFMCVVGKMPEQNTYGPRSTLGGDPYVELQRIPNRADVPLAVVPGRISLDDAQGQFDGLVGMFQQQAMLMALEMHGMRRAVFPETWAVSPITGEPAVIEVMADPSQGVMGALSGGDIKQVRIEPSTLTTQFVDRSERNQHVQGGIPAEYGGESASNVRTGRRGSNILSETVDFQIQAVHKVLEHSMAQENKIAVAIEKKYFPGTRTIVTQTHGEITYNTDEIWETDHNFVRYAQAGSDINDVTVAGGQMVGMGAMSKRTLMEVHPMIPDAEVEADQIIVEQLEAAALSGMQQQAASDPSFVVPLMDILKLVKSNKMDLVEAFAKVQEDLQAKQQQAQQGELPPEQAQPGIAAPQPQIAEQPQGLANMDQLLQSLRGTSRGAVPA